MCTCWNTILLGLLAVQVLLVNVVSPTANKFSFAVLVTSVLVKSNKCNHQDLIIEHVVDLQKGRISLL